MKAWTEHPYTANPCTATSSSCTAHKRTNLLDQPLLRVRPDHRTLVVASRQNVTNNRVAAVLHSENYCRQDQSGQHGDEERIRCPNACNHQHQTTTPRAQNQNRIGSSQCDASQPQHNTKQQHKRKMLDQIAEEESCVPATALTRTITQMATNSFFVTRLYEKIRLSSNKGKPA